MIKVSVVVPVYNTERYLDKCLLSLVNQSIDSIEIIVVNDGSTDESQLIIDKYVLKYPNLVKAYTKINGGLSDARNYGLKMAAGEYIGFVDSDDYVDLDMFKNLYDFAISKCAEIVECNYKNFYLENNEEHFFDSDYKTPKKYQDIIRIDENKKIIVEITDMAWNKIYKSKLFTETEIEYPKGLWHEDYATTPILISKAERYILIDYVGYYYLQRDNSITHSLNEKSLDVIECFFYSIKEMKRLKTYDGFKDQLYAKYIHLFWRSIGLTLQLKETNSKEIQLKELMNRMYEISMCFENDFSTEKNFYIRESSKAIVNKNYIKFSTIINSYKYLQIIKKKVKRLLKR